MWHTHQLRSVTAINGINVSCKFHRVETLKSKLKDSPQNYWPDLTNVNAEEDKNGKRLLETNKTKSVQRVTLDWLLEKQRGKTKL